MDYSDRVDRVLDLRNSAEELLGDKTVASYGDTQISRDAPGILVQHITSNQINIEFFFPYMSRPSFQVHNNRSGVSRIGELALMVNEALERSVQYG
jgi:hypothetical protein